MIDPAELSRLRKEYSLHELTEAHTAPDPFGQFRQWLEEALRSGLPEPTAVHLCTVSADGRPSGRIVLLKGFSGAGFTFFTNYESRKGQELAGNPQVCLTFFWPEIERQVRIEGTAAKVAPQVSKEYFESRPRGSQIGAIASPQSRVILDRQVLEEKVEQLSEHYRGDKAIARPAHWGGYCVVPSAIEFWQGRPSRLHDRILYTPDPKGGWLKQRLAP
jgi:pyridoxamine 5'-phosphate oxidase